QDVVASHRYCYEPELNNYPPGKAFALSEPRSASPLVRRYLSMRQLVRPGTAPVTYTRAFPLRRQGESAAPVCWQGLWRCRNQIEWGDRIDPSKRLLVSHRGG